MSQIPDKTWWRAEAEGANSAGDLIGQLVAKRRIFLVASRNAIGMLG